MNLYQCGNVLVVAASEKEARRIAESDCDVSLDEACKLISWEQKTVWSVINCDEPLSVGENGQVGVDDGDSWVTYKQVLDFYASRGGKFPGVLGMAEYC